MLGLKVGGTCDKDKNVDVGEVKVAQCSNGFEENGEDSKCNGKQAQVTERMIDVLEYKS